MLLKIILSLDETSKKGPLINICCPKGLKCLVTPLFTHVISKIHTRCKVLTLFWFDAFFLIFRHPDVSLVAVASRIAHENTEFGWILVVVAGQGTSSATCVEMRVCWAVILFYEKQNKKVNKRKRTKKIFKYRINWYQV